jgi:hypothetical protein
MPPQSAAKDVTPVASGDAADVMVLEMMDRMHLLRTHHVSAASTSLLERIHSCEKVPPLARLASDLSFYVGRTWVSYTLSADTLKHSTYFASVLTNQHILSPIVLDCDKATFYHMVLILRYGSFQALPQDV